MNVKTPLILAMACTACSGAGLDAPLPEAPPLDATLGADEHCFEAVATALSSDEMEGRGVGTDGLRRAEAFIARELERAGLEPLSDGYRQEFEAIVGVELGDANALALGDDMLEAGVDFTPLGFTSNGSFEGELVFAGYGIDAEELGYNDYASLDVSGKVVLAMRFEPGEDDPDSPFDGRRPTRWSDLRYKAFVARERGASALLLVDPPREQDEEAARSRLPALRSLGPVSQAGLPVLQVTMDVADRWLEPAGRSLDDVAREIASDYAPRSMPLDGAAVTGTADVSVVRTEVANILARLPGAGALAEEHVVIGAHFDHLGYGGRGSMRPGEEAIHNGADDNASGVAAVLCAAGTLAEEHVVIGAHFDHLGYGGRGSMRPGEEAIHNGADDNASGVAAVLCAAGTLAAEAAAAGPGPRRSILVAAFTAEELGLGGSGWYVDNPLVPLDDTAAMINLDMVGRVREQKLRALGTDSAEGWAELVAEAADGTGLVIEPGGDGYGPSDQTLFYERGVPVVHLFSGAHDEYHTPDDDAPLLNMEGGGAVAGVVARLASTLASRVDRLAWAPPAEVPAMNTDSRGYGAYLGTIPDYTAMSAPGGGGVLLSGVRPGGPADKGGVRGGDVLVELAGTTIDNLYDMTFALRENRPGETVSVVVLRDGERVTLSATLGSRGE